MRLDGGLLEYELVDGEPWIRDGNGVRPDGDADGDGECDRSVEDGDGDVHDLDEQLCGDGDSAERGVRGIVDFDDVLVACDNRWNDERDVDGDFALFVDGHILEYGLADGESRFRDGDGWPAGSRHDGDSEQYGIGAHGDGDAIDGWKQLHGDGDAAAGSVVPGIVVVHDVVSGGGREFDE